MANGERFEGPPQLPGPSTLRKLSTVAWLSESWRMKFTTCGKIGVSRYGGASRIGRGIELTLTVIGLTLAEEISAAVGGFVPHCCRGISALQSRASPIQLTLVSSMNSGRLVKQLPLNACSSSPTSLSFLAAFARIHSSNSDPRSCSSVNEEKAMGIRACNCFLMSELSCWPVV